MDIIVVHLLLKTEFTEYISQNSYRFLGGDSPLEPVDDFADITVTSNKIAKKIEPSKPGRFYTYYQSKEADSSYFALILKAKNLSTEGITADKIAEVGLKYDNKYDYDTFSTIEKRGGEDFTYTNITDIDPLKTGTIYYLVEIPNEVAKSDKPLKAEIKIQDQTFEYTVR